MQRIHQADKSGNYQQLQELLMEKVEINRRLHG
jgi:hypothetical protein